MIFFQGCHLIPSQSLKSPKIGTMPKKLVKMGISLIVLYHTTNTCLSMFDETQTVNDAIEMFLMAGGQLAKITSAAENSFILNLLKSKGISGDLWIGVNELSVCAEVVTLLIIINYEFIFSNKEVGSMQMEVQYSTNLGTLYVL